MNLQELHKEINRLVELELKANPVSYNKKMPYQSYDRINFKGIRWTPEKRIMKYGIINFLTKKSKILDIGSNFGFLTCELALTAELVHGIEPNEYLNKIGELTAKYLGIENKVKFFNEKFSNFNSEIQYDIVLSLAAFYTGDGREREDARDYFGRVYKLLCPNGVIIFESTSYDSANKGASYDAIQIAIDTTKGLFQTIECVTKKSGSPGWVRDYFVGRKIGL